MTSPGRRVSPQANDDTVGAVGAVAPGETGLMRPLVRLSKRDALGRLAVRVRGSFVVACLLRFVRIRGRDRMLVLAGQAFTALVPLFILLATFGPNDGSIGDRMIDRFRLTGSAADAVRTLFTRPPGQGGALTVAGVVVLFFALLSYARTLQQTYESAWDLPSVGLRGTVSGLAGMGLMLCQIGALALLGGVLRRLPSGDTLAFIVPGLFAVVLWLQLQRLLLSGRVTRRRLLPGALAAGAGQVVAAVFSSAWMPHLISKNSERYGVIGVTFALLTWLIVMSAGIVVAAVVSAEAGALRPHTPTDQPEEAPMTEIHGLTAPDGSRPC